MDYASLFSDRPDTARLWIYIAQHDVSADTQRVVHDALASFFGAWDSHGRPVSADMAWREDRFLFVTAHVETEDASISGCATDALVHAVDEATQSLAWAPALSVSYRDAEGSVAVTDRTTFARLARAHTVDSTTSVFDPSLSTLADLHNGAFEQPAGTTWHARAFPLAHPA
ncbi:MAG: hypothetical protein ACQETP_02915 [Bacteroidota bacterium]